MNINCHTATRAEKPAQCLAVMWWDNSSKPQSLSKRHEGLTSDSRLLCAAQTEYIFINIIFVCTKMHWPPPHPPTHPPSGFWVSLTTPPQVISQAHCTSYQSHDNVARWWKERGHIRDAEESWWRASVSCHEPQVLSATTISTETSLSELIKLRLW